MAVITLSGLGHRLIELSEARTRQGERLKSALSDFLKEWPRFDWRVDQELLGLRSDSVSPSLVGAAKRLLPLLSLTFEGDPERGDFHRKKNLGRLRNFRKIVEKVSKIDASDDQGIKALGDYVVSVGTKSKDSWEKIYDYSRFIQGFVDALDVDKEGSLSAGGWDVRLMSSAYNDWNRENTGKIKWAIDDAVSKIKAAGLGKAVGGRMHAFPTYSVPMSGGGRGGVLALYDTREDLTVIASEGPAKKLSDNLIHELGHRYYYQVMGSRGRKAWSQFFDAGKGAVKSADKIIYTWKRFIEDAGGRGTKKGERMATSRGFAEASSAMGGTLEFWADTIYGHLEVAKLEKLHKRTGLPKKGSKVAFDIFQDKAREIEIFLKPVTSYSTKNKDELFAETFLHYVTDGPRRIPPVVLGAFKQAAPHANK